MYIITLNDRVIYRADTNKKVKFKDSNSTYSEISVNLDDTREVEEVANANT